MRLALLVLSVALALGGCTFSSSDPPPPASGTTVVVPSGSGVTP